MIKKIEELKLDEAKKIVGGANKGCGECLLCDCDPHGEASENLSFGLGRVITPKAQGCKPGNAKDPVLWPK